MSHGLPFISLTSSQVPLHDRFLTILSIVCHGLMNSIFAPRYLRGSWKKNWFGFYHLSLIWERYHFLDSSLCICCSHLPKLGCVEFQYYDDQGSGDPADVAVFQPEFPDGAFPSLWDLSLTASYREVQRFLTIPFAPTNITVLHIESSEFESPAHLHQLLVTISENCQMLKILTLISPRRVLRDQITVPDGLSQVTADTLKSALACSSLTSLEVVHQFPLKLTQKDLEIFAKCWVSLETLNLNTEPHYFKSSNLTLEAIFPFAQYCPRLAYLALFIDVSFGALSLSTASPRPHFKCLQHLAVGFSAVEEPISVARFLSRVLPLGCHVDDGVIWSDSFELEPGGEIIAAERCSMWSKVDQLLPTLIMVREEEREGMNELQRELDRVRGQVHDLTEQLDALFGMTESWFIYSCSLYYDEVFPSLGEAVLSVPLAAFNKAHIVIIWTILTQTRFENTI